ncbi:MAG TPA: diaminopimelate epimerase [Syntrophomonadaceae bacterium]|nr:diaminopimelate epimerase [Syntrophomonadaceae bacterium]
MHFTKWHGLGNDFILIEEDPGFIPEDQLSGFARRICNRNFGVGGDGLVLVFQEQGLLNMRIFNADGSEPEMCGNAIRCVARYAYERGLVKDRSFEINTRSGIKLPEIILDGEEVVAVKVDMGEPILTGEAIPVAGYDGARVIEEDITVGGESFKFTAVSMGNPHCLLFVPDVSNAPVKTLGPRLEHHKIFPNQTNVEFIEVKTPEEINLRVWERGVGETLACGTGTCAAVVGGVLTGRLDRRVQVNLPGGRLLVEWAANNHVYMTGPAEEVFEGRLSESFLNHHQRS